MTVYCFQSNTVHVQWALEQELSVAVCHSRNWGSLAWYKQNMKRSGSLLCSHQEQLWSSSRRVGRVTSIGVHLPPATTTQWVQSDRRRPCTSETANRLSFGRWGSNITRDKRQGGWILHYCSERKLPRRAGGRRRRRGQIRKMAYL